MHFDIHCQACASYVRVRVWVGVRVSVEFSYLFNQARCTDVSARSLCLVFLTNIQMNILSRKDNKIIMNPSLPFKFCAAEIKITATV